MEYSYISPFAYEEFCFEGAHVYSVGNKSFLLSSNGTSIVLDDNTVSLLSQKVISEDLAIKLFQRGFGTAYGHHRFIERNNIPNYFMIDFTTKCNCNCIYCLRHFENEGNSITEDMLKKITQFIVNYCKTNSIERISFQPWGGEPLIEIDKIIECKKMFELSGISTDINIQTNGLLLTVPVYEKLKENNIMIGVSIDGVESVHNRHRTDINNNPTHEKIVKNLKAIYSKYPNANIGSLSVNSKASLVHINESINYLVKDLGIHSLKFNLVHPSGISSFDKSILIEKNEINTFVDSVINEVVFQNLNGRNCIEANILDKLNNLLDRYGKNICNSSGCRGGYSFISFDQNGNIFPCEMIGREEYRLGSINEGKDLLAMINDAKSSNSFYRQKEIEKCKNCPFLYYCRGGCKANCIAYNKMPYCVDTIECELNKSIYPRLIELILTKPEVVELLVGKRIRLSL